MIGRNPGCEAIRQDNGRDELLLPVCVWGAAIAGAFAIIKGCNNPKLCVPQLSCPEGYVNYAVSEGGHVTGVYEIKKDTQPYAPNPVDQLVSDGQLQDASGNEDKVPLQPLIVDNHANQRLSFTPYCLVPGI